jgi:hypothetical protein
MRVIHVLEPLDGGLIRQLAKVEHETFDAPAR